MLTDDCIDILCWGSGIAIPCRLRHAYLLGRSAHVLTSGAWTFGVRRWAFSSSFNRHKRHPALRTFAGMIRHHFGMHRARVFLLRLLLGWWSRVQTRRFARKLRRTRRALLRSTILKFWFSS